MKSFKFLQTSPFHYWEITFLAPKVKWGKVHFSEDYDGSVDNGHKYSVQFNTDIGFYEDNHYKTAWLIVLGFGISLRNQEGY